MPVTTRDSIPHSDTWNLAALYESEMDWKSELESIEQRMPHIRSFAGTLGQSVERLVETLEFYLKMSRALEKVYVFAHLQSDQDTSNSLNLGKLDRATNLYTRAASEWSFLTPEILGLTEDQIKKCLEHPSTAPYRRMLHEIIRFKPHTLSKEEENLLASASEVLGSAEKIFSQLNNADLSFGTVSVDGQQQSLSHGSFMVFLKHPDRQVRQSAFEQYYGTYDAHKHSIAAALSSSVKRDIFVARTRRHESALAKALFADNVRPAVYDNLIQVVSDNLAPLHKYYELRKRLLKLDEMRIFDTHTPLVGDIKTDVSFDDACRFVLDSLSPLGTDYTSVLEKGLLSERWVDKFENQGKRSGAYSSGCYDSMPYILMNYKRDNFHDMFTLAHEAGHSMHTYFSVKNQAYQDHGYTIFVAEVASTFNEQLLSHHLRQVYANEPRMLAYLINQQIDDIKGTLYRQTMFAEFERHIHDIAEKNEPLTLRELRSEYRRLLEKYFGPSAKVTELDELECLRIPHFYSAFYVYKYATGLSAAISLSRDVLEGKPQATEKYLGFLKGGCSKYPLELLQDAGVDIAAPQPIQAALKLFSRLVDDLEAILLMQ